MGFFGIADAATVSIIPTTDAIAYVPHHTITENVKQNEETNKETAIETTQPIKEITPPPAYIADTSSPVPEALSNIDVLDSTSEAHRKSSDIKPRAIKPLPQRNEPKTSLERSSDKGKTVPYTEKTGLGESKDIVDQTKDIHSVACLGKAVDFLPPPAPSQPYVFVAGNSGLQFPSKGFPSSSFAPASTSSSAFTTTAFPAPTACYTETDYYVTHSKFSGSTVKCACTDCRIRANKFPTTDERSYSVYSYLGSIVQHLNAVHQPDHPIFIHRPSSRLYTHRHCGHHPTPWYLLPQLLSQKRGAFYQF
ncbi:hypothetical protein PtrM4_016410 [Pyrenophora tritici-repentis]|uniref:Uncharacterized protein n=1 Tax=Pyrenophora tritici-repentis TaxID=45151 RepID=A0A834VUM6_9PLEO|nr:hypothetical protein PtrM4_016410 [Pyrenophora tritici-repentis]